MCRDPPESVFRYMVRISPTDTASRGSRRFHTLYFFSRIIAALANVILGIPTVNYFDEIGPMSKSSISDEALGAFSYFFRI